MTSGKRLPLHRDVACAHLAVTTALSALNGDGSKTLDSSLVVGYTRGGARKHMTTRCVL